MKKYFLVIACICAVILSGCGNKKEAEVKSQATPSAPNKKIEKIIIDLAKAAKKDDLKEMTRLGNLLEKENIKPKEITIGSKCVELIYSYDNKEQKYEYCK